jgi:hypothetical protein
LLVVFAGGPVVHGVQNRWSPPLDASVALKIGKNGQEARKLWPPKVGGVCFYRKCLIEHFIAYFGTPQKILKYYSVSFRVTR